MTGGLLDLSVDWSDASGIPAGAISAGNFTGNYRFIGNLIVGNSANLSPNTSGIGHLSIYGSGYTGYVTLDGTAMRIGHTSTARNIQFDTDETTRATINATGLGIGMTPSYKLDVNGTARFTTAIRSSSRRWKSDIVDMVPDPAGFGALRFRQYTLDKDDGRQGYGLVAEELEGVYRDAVRYGEDGLPEAVEYDAIWARSAVMVQDHEERIRVLEAELDRLRGLH